MRWRRAARGTLGLEIGSQAVCLVAVRHAAARPCLAAAARAALPANALHGHLVRDGEAVAGVVRSLLASVPVSSRRWPVVTAVPASAVMVRRLTLAAGGGAALDAGVVREAAAIVPDGLAHAVLDYHVLETAADGAARVLLVAARGELVRGYTGALRAAGLEPSAVDVDLFALCRAHPGAAADVLLHAGPRTVSVAVVDGGVPDLAGDVPAGPGADAESVAAGVVRVLDAAGALRGARRPVVVAGGTQARLAGVVDALSRSARLTVELLDPFDGLCRRDRAAAGCAGDPPAFGVAVGLALRHPERPWW